MKMSVENGPHNKTEYIDPVEKMETDGWVIVGRESLTRTKFSAEAKFIEVPYQTEESIKARPASLKSF